MVAVPMPQLLGHRADFITRQVSTAQCVHHVQMDISKDTCIELEVPFVSPYNCFDLIDGKFDWAEVKIMVYSPLNQVGGCPLECELFTYFKNIELGTPTSGPVQQSAAASSRSIEEERASEARGTFTGALSKLGTSAVGAALSSISPVTGAIDKGLAAFGWSKPVLAKPSQVFLNRPNEGFNLCDGVDQSLVLGMSGANNVDAMPGLCGTMQDETSFDALKRIPQFVAVFAYNDQVVSGTTDTCPIAGAHPLLWSCCVSPSTYVPACYYVRPTAALQPGLVNPYQFRWKQPTTLNYITAPFLYWTGSMVYTFKFVKTNYHSGRVEIAFHPFVNSMGNDVQGRMDYARRVIVDLRKSSEVSLTVPFVSPQPWKRISTYLDPMNPNPPAPGRLKDITTGMISVRAITPLVSNGAVCAREIEVLVEARAGDDFQVQAPVTSKFLPFSFQNPNRTAAPTQQSFITKIIDDAIKEKKDCFPRQQSGIASLRVPAKRGRFYTTWATDGNNPAYHQTYTGLTGVPMVLMDISGDVSNWGQTTPTALWFDLPTTWDNGAQPIRFFNKGMTYHFTYSIILANPDNRDTLVVSISRGNMNAGVANDIYFAIDCNIYPLQASDPTSSVVRIDPSQLPLPTTTSIEQPLSVTLSGRDNVIMIDESQLPLPTASEGGGGVVTIDPASLPLDVKINQTDDNNGVQIVNQPLEVNATVLNEEIPVKIPRPLDVHVTNNVPTTITNTPLPVSGGGSGGGGTVRIDPEQLPLWVSEWDVAPVEAEELERRERKRRLSLPIQQSVSAAGIFETRTRAMSGWMPPCITGNRRDAHRPNTDRYCAGESFHSMRQLTRRFAFCLVNQISSNASFPIQPVELVRPGALHLRITAGTGRTQYALYAPNTRSEVSGSPLSYVAGMYAFYRGGSRFKVWTESRANPPELISGNLEYLRQSLESADVISDNIENFMGPCAYETPRLKQFAEFQVPYYSPTVCSSVWSHATDNQFDSPLAQLNLSIPDGPLKNGVPTTDVAPIKVAVAGADDFDLHLFIGPPPVIDIGAIARTERMLHYPPSGFTPTQKILLDPNRVEEAATRFWAVPYSTLTVVNNAGGNVCPIDPPAPPTTTSTASTTTYTDCVSANRVRRETPYQDGRDEVGTTIDTRLYQAYKGPISYYDSPN